jgi:hypothetical protein
VLVKSSKQRAFIRLRLLPLNSSVSWRFWIMFEIEFEAPNDPKLCECCGGLTTSLTRFVYRNGDAFAVYWASFTDNHPDRLVKLLIGIGQWGDGTSKDDRRGFAMDLRVADSQYEIMVTNAEQSPWKAKTIIGHILDREEALADSWIKEVFHLTDHILSQDILIKDFLNKELRAS